MEVWKTLVAPLIVAVVGAVLATFVLSRVQAPEVPEVSARVQWIDLANPFRGLDRKQASELEKAAKSAWGPSELGSLLQWMQYSGLLRISNVALHNNSNIRSKELELSIKDRGGLWSPQNAAPDKQFSSAITIKPLNPDASANVLAISIAYSKFIGPDILALHDNVKTNVTSLSMPEEIMGLVSSAFEYPMVSALLAMLMVFSTALMWLIAFPISMIAWYSPSFRARITTAAEIKKLKEFLDYIQKHYPDNLK